MGKKKGKKNKLLVLLDFENLYIHFASKSIIEELEKILKQIAKEVGPIFKIFVFVPYNTASIFAEDFYGARFVTILCSKVRGKDGNEKDTVDELLIDAGEGFIAEMPDLTHLFIGSGDIDFLKLIKKASRAGLDVGLIVSDLRPLSHELIKWTDKKPGTNERMVYIFSQPEK